MPEENANQEPRDEPKPDNEYQEEEEEEEPSDSEDDILADLDPELKEGIDSIGRNPPEKNVELFLKVLSSKRYKESEKAERERLIRERNERYNFPEDKENWTEEDLMELWTDASALFHKTGWDPHHVDEEEIEAIERLTSRGKKPHIAPFYLPYRQFYPMVPPKHPDIRTPKDVIEELDRIEEFLTWVSYIFPDGSTYEGTVWDDLAHGKGVFVAEEGLVRYEGEWLQNNMEGHGVVEVDIPTMEPVPGSKLEAKMRAQGKIIKRDYMSPEDREWLEMDIEDAIQLSNDVREIPFYENDEWITQFGSHPEKGRYRYAGQWKHGRMHGCGVFELNERIRYGRFYFGELLQEDTYGCDADISAMHAGIAEVAAAKARMFVNKPDGMVREQWGPYSDPQHPYLYEEDDVWMAPGFINQFYEVPDYWKTYVHEVDEEREMWLNSFYKAPLRLPMPAELEYWWANEEEPEFILINKDPEPHPKDPRRLIYTEDPLILHTPTGRIINYVEDEEHGIRLFWQPHLGEGEKVDPERALFLPLGFDEFYGKVSVTDSFLKRLITSIEDMLKPWFEKLEKWAEEQKKSSEMKIELLKAEIELREAELSLKEAIEDMDEELKRMQKEEEKKAKLGLLKEEDILTPEQAEEVEKTKAKEDEDEDEDGNEAADEEEEEEAADEEDVTSSSFGSIEEDLTRNDQKGKGAGKSPFAASSLSFTASSLFSVVPLSLKQSFSAWKKSKLNTDMPRSLFSISCLNHVPLGGQNSNLVTFLPTAGKCLSLRAKGLKHLQGVPIIKLQSRNCSKHRAYARGRQHFEERSFSILSLHTPIDKR